MLKSCFRIPLYLKFTKVLLRLLYSIWKMWTKTQWCLYVFFIKRWFFYSLIVQVMLVQSKILNKFVYLLAIDHKRSNLAWNLLANVVKADTELRCVDECWIVWIWGIFYWSTFVFNSVVLVWNFGSGYSGYWVSPGITSCIWCYRDSVFSFMLSNLSCNIVKIYWVSFSLLSSIDCRYNMGSGNVLVSEGTVNLERLQYFTLICEPI